MNKTIMITGANAGIGKETARQLAMKKETEKIYLACRNMTKAIVAKKELERETGRKIFEIIIMDVSKPESVRSAIDKFDGEVDALIMNAGGIGGKTPTAKTKDGVTNLYATNLLGHSVLVDELIQRGKLNNVALYAGSEAARGIKKMGIKSPKLKQSSVEEFKEIAEGSYFSDEDNMTQYGHVKYMAALWMSSLARKYQNIKFITMSPGGTRGTNGANDMPFVQRFMYKYIFMPILLPLMGMSHKLEKGAARFVNGITDKKFRSGIFYASKGNVLTGEVIDQSSIFPDLKNESIQNNANLAISSFIA